MVPDVMIPAAKGSRDILAFAIPVDYSSTTVSPVKLTFSEEVTSNEKNIVSSNVNQQGAFELTICRFD